MIVGHSDELERINIEHEGAEAVIKKVVMGPDQGWDSHVMRIFELGKGGHTPKHTHPWPHINFMLSGEGILYFEGEEHPVKAGSYALVDAGKEHQYRNAGDEPFIFICIVPKGRDY